MPSSVQKLDACSHRLISEKSEVELPSAKQEKVYKISLSFFLILKQELYQTSENQSFQLTISELFECSVTRT
jgi:hypothetical protein